MESFEPTWSENTATGAAVFAGIEGTRPVLVEFQALVAEIGGNTETATR